MAVIVFAALFGVAIGAGFVQVAAFRSESFSWRTVAVTGFVAVILVGAIATVVGYFLARVRIGDHYEVNSVLMAVLVIEPAAAGALAGVIAGGASRATLRGLADEGRSSPKA